MNYNKLKNILSEKRINIPTLAKEIGMSKAGLYLAVEKETITVDTLEKIAKVVGISIISFFDFNLDDLVPPFIDVEKLKTDNEQLTQRISELQNIITDKQKIIEYLELNNKFHDLNQDIRNEVEHGNAELMSRLWKLKAFNPLQLAEKGKEYFESAEYKALTKEADQLMNMIQDKQQDNPEYEILFKKVWEGLEEYEKLRKDYDKE